jgi:DnaJ-class molecular chaperone
MQNFANYCSECGLFLTSHICPECSGRGKKGFIFTNSCTMCNGSGKIKLCPNHAQHGTHTFQNSPKISLRCYRCNGTGEVEDTWGQLSNPIRPTFDWNCMFCNGTGKQFGHLTSKLDPFWGLPQQKCDHCGGSGKQNPIRITPEPIPIKVTCPICNGKGKI